VILIADDSPVARCALARQLRTAGFEVVEQATARPPEPETVARVAGALLDLDFDGGDGSDLAGALRAQRSALPIAFFSATVSEEVLARARPFGPVFAKPHELQQAIAWVRTICEPEPAGLRTTV